MKALSTSPMRRTISRSVATCALAGACVLPGRAAAQGPAAGDALNATEHPAPVSAPRPELPKLVALVQAFEAPKPIDTAKPFAAWSASAHNLRDSIVVSIARTQIGTRYVRGGQSPSRGFDCSGLVRYVLGGMNIPLPRTAAQQAETGISVGRDTSRLRPGDLVTFGKSRRGNASHIGIYLGNGRFVHASSVAGRVIESDIGRPKSPMIKPWRGTRRVLGDTDGAVEVKGDN